MPASFEDDRYRMTEESRPRTCRARSRPQPTAKYKFWAGTCLDQPGVCWQRSLVWQCSRWAEARGRLEARGNTGWRINITSTPGLYRIAFRIGIGVPVPQISIQ
eukprot:1288759-Pyramimonas_sp.AAC.1